MKSAKGFYEAYLGKIIDYDKGYGVQCVDGARCWMDYFLDASIPCSGGWASGYWTGNQNWFKSKGCKLITRVSDLRDGDLVIWNKKSASHPSSHVAMYYQGKEFGQNQGGNRVFCLKATNFNDMLGAYRAPTCTQPANSMNTTSTKEAIDQILHVGSHVKFANSMRVTKIDSKKGLAYVPDIGGWISANPLTEVNAADGSLDQHLHVGSCVTIRGVFTVTAVNKNTNCVQLKAYSGATNAWAFNFWINAKCLNEVA